MVFLQALAGRDQLVAKRVRELGGQQEADRDVRPERTPQLFRENAASAESVPGHLVPSQQREGTVHGLVQVNPITIIYIIIIIIMGFGAVVILKYKFAIMIMIIVVCIGTSFIIQTAAAGGDEKMLRRN